MSYALDISNASYYMVIMPLNGRIYFSPCNFLTTSPFENSMQNAACLQIKDCCITNRSRDDILSIGDHCTDDYMNRSGSEDYVFVDNLIDKILQASIDPKSQFDNSLIQLFMNYAILQAIKNSGTHRDVNEEALKSWIHIVVTPIEWGKRVASNALFSVFAGSKFITPSNALVIPALDALLFPYLQMESYAERNTLANSKNILCELSVGKGEDASLSMDIFSITKLKGPQYDARFMTIDSFLSIPTLFSKNRIQINAGYRDLVELFRNVVQEKDELSTLVCNELLSKLCRFLFKLEGAYQEQGSMKLDKLFPFQACNFPPAIAEQGVSALRLVTLKDIYAALSPRWELILPEIQLLIEREVCITRIYFIVIPEVPQLYSDPIEDTLFISIVLMKLKLEASSIKKFKFIYDRIKRLHDNIPLPYKPIDDHLKRTVAGVSLKLREKLRAICHESLPLSSLTHTLSETGSISTISYVYLSTNQVFTQNVSVNENGKLRRLSAQKSDIMTLDQFLVLDDAEARSEEAMLRFLFSKSALSLLESMFPAALREFAVLYREPKVESIPEEDVTDVSCPNLGNSYNTLHRKNEQLFHSEPNEHGMYYTKIMAELAHRQSESGSPRIHTTQQKYIGAFLMVYFGYLKETLEKDFGQESDSTRYILVFEQLMRNVTIGQIDDKLMRKALHYCGWVSETEENKRKLMVYDIEDNFPISECLQKENIKTIPANTQFTVVSMTRYYVKTCYFQALEDILPTDKYYKTIKGGDFTYPIDFYDIICNKIWHHVVESIYETDPLLEYSSNVDIMDIDFTLESYKSFKVAFNNYMLNTFPLTYASHPDEKYRFPLHLKQGDCSIVLTNRLVLRLGVIPAFVTLMNTTKEPTRHSTFVFFRPFNFDDENNSSLPMLELLESELKKLIEIRFKEMIWISTRQFVSVHSHQCLKSVIGDTAFGYEALKTGVIRAAESGSFALGFRYFTNDKASLVEVISNQSGLYQPIQETDACIITKLGAPYDNTKKHSFISDLVFKIPNLKSVFKIHIIKINDTYQRNIGDIVAIQNYDHTILSTFDMRELVFRDDVEKFVSFPFVSLLLVHSPPGYINSIVLHSNALNRPLAAKSIIHPLKVAYFDSYEENVLTI